jgi:hypothetical protein
MMARTTSWLALWSIAALPAYGQVSDGIPAEWKTQGITVTLPGGETRFLDLRSKGASPQHRDVIVWVNWMEEPGKHSHRPLANTSRAEGSSRAIEKDPLDRVKAAFQRQGINLIVLEGGPLNEVPEIGGTDGDGKYDWTELDALTRAQFPESPAEFGQVVHRCTFIHQMAGVFRPYTGLARSIPGREFLVSLGGSANGIGTADSQSGTFMHELGHDLGLRHGGRDDTLRKPNYLSVMNYLFQVTGLMKDSTLGNFDFSSRSFDFNEDSVDGSKGVTTDTSLKNYGSAETCDVFFARYRFFESVNQPLAWDCTARAPKPGAAPKDINKDGNVGRLAGYNDWGNIILLPFAPGAGVPAFTVPSPEDELPQDRIAALLGGITVPRLTLTLRPDGIDIRWPRVPLASVLAYQLLRTRRGGRTDVIRETKKTEFVDTTAQPGVLYTYQVRLVFNGPGAETIDRVAATVRGVGKALLEDWRSVIPAKPPVGEVLMLGQPSAPARATRR